MPITTQFHHIESEIEPVTSLRVASANANMPRHISYSVDPSSGKNRSLKGAHCYSAGEQMAGQQIRRKTTKCSYKSRNIKSAGDFLV
jgi:hypothetical protein